MKSKLQLFVSLTITFLIFKLGHSMTTTPGRPSGNGNPAILLFLPLFIMLIVLIVQWCKVLDHKKFHMRTLIILSVICIAHQVMGVYYQIIRYRSYRDYLAEVYKQQFGEIDWHYIHSITAGLSIHINNQFFNTNTYFMFVSFSLLIWSLSQIIMEIQKRR
ncbi:hypothetical protein [Paenibacillus lemnae]|uniref:Uncharacterized protein n=1 Tax=Paenibacillus lemnae TaxID=1330551 RepID=A0A848MBT8_PAELE|nr:hypothetical protein [Paenibacillus lemnae]NMO97699.1 hypothetical protein [Paenibacillus lemnae]